MAITQRTLRLVQEMRQSLDKILDGTTRDLTKAWVRAWDELIAVFNAAADELIAAAMDGRWPSRAQVARSTRAQRALDLAAQSLAVLAMQASNDISKAAWQAVYLAVESYKPILLSQLPPRAEVGIGFDRIDLNAVEWIVKRTTEQINARHWPLAMDATEAMRRELVRGVVVGDNPRTAARNIVTRCEGAFNGGLSRAVNIARTEMLDAHRAGAQASQDADADVLAGWIWHCKLDTRSCPSCWAMHGTLHPLAEPGPLDHQSGRCSRTPKTKTWAELGFDIPEPPDVLPDAQSAFRALPRDDQLKIMGPQRLNLLDAGRINWADIPQRRTTTGWRDSYHARSASDLERGANQRDHAA